MFSVLEARAGMNNNKAKDNTGIVHEHLKTLTYRGVMSVHESFTRLYTGRDKEHPEQRNITRQTGKPKLTGTLTVTEFRWLSITDHLNQWYNRSWRDQFWERPQITKVHTWGFTKGVGPEPVQDIIIRTAVQKAHVWGYPLLVGDFDVEQAFGYMDHEELDNVNRDREINVNASLAALRDYTDKNATARLDGVGTTPEFRLGTGGRQGGVRTSDEWKNLQTKRFSQICR